VRVNNTEGGGRSRRYILLKRVLSKLKRKESTQKKNPEGVPDQRVKRLLPLV